MNKIIKINEAIIKQIIAESAKKILSQAYRQVSESLGTEGTDKQNSYLQYLAGDEWDDNWKNLSVKDTSTKIDYYKNNPMRKKAVNSNTSSNLATMNQLNFIKANNYYPLPFIDKIKDKLTKSDASLLCSVLTPYMNDMGNGGEYRRKLKVNEWFPYMAETVISVLQKYGLNSEGIQVKGDMARFAAEPRKNYNDSNVQATNKTNIVFTPSNDENANNAEPAHNIYMHGKIKDFFSWDLVTINIGYGGYGRMQHNVVQDYLMLHRTLHTYSCKVVGYDNPCLLMCWPEEVKANKYQLTGIIINVKEYAKYYGQAAELAGKLKNAGNMVG